jgi:DNA ligase 1
VPQFVEITGFKAFSGWLVGAEEPVRASKPDMLALAQTAEAVAATTKKSEKVALVAEYLRSRETNAAALSAQYLSGRAFASWEERTLQVGGSLLWRAVVGVSGAAEAELSAAVRKYGDLGAGAYDVLAAHHAVIPTLTVEDVARSFDQLAEARSANGKAALLSSLLEKATPLEAKYIIKIITTELRIGLKESLVEESIAKAFEAPLSNVKRANMLLGDIAETVRLAAAGKLDEARMRLFHPIGFMLATPAESAAEAFEQFADAVIEDKYDGIRAQVHVSPSRGGSEAKVTIYSRTLDEIGESFPELGPSLAGIADEVVLDGEILAWRNGEALAFSALQKRLGRKRVTPRMMAEVPVEFVAFDILARNGSLVIDEPLSARRKMLEEVFAGIGAPVEHRLGQTELLFGDAMPPDETRLILAPMGKADSAAHIDELFETAQARGNEGLMVKDAASPYTPGRRGQSWLKIKRELATLDVVVTAVEPGHGKRANVLSDYTFAVRDGERLVNVGKAYTGLTDLEIAEMTRRFHDMVSNDLGYVLEVHPEVVIEVAFNAVMKSDRHESGFALRFPRIVRLRPDKPVEEIDTVERVEEIFSSQYHSTNREAH